MLSAVVPVRRVGQLVKAWIAHRGGDAHRQQVQADAYRPIRGLVGEGCHRTLFVQWPDEIVGEVAGAGELASGHVRAMSAKLVDYSKLAFDLIDELERFRTPGEMIGRISSALSQFGFSGFLISTTPDLRAASQRQTFLTAGPTISTTTTLKTTVTRTIPS